MQSVFESDQTYWQNKFDSDDRIVCLSYTSMNRNKDADRTMRTLSVQFPSILSERIVSITSGVPLAAFMVLLTGAQALFYKYANEECMIVGVPVVGSSSSEINPIVLVKNPIDPNKGFRILLNNVKAAVTEAFDHQTLPFWNYTEQMNIPQLADGVPLIHTVVTMRQLHSVSYTRQVAHELAFHFDLTNSSVSLDIEYDENRYDEDSMERLSAHLLQLLSIVLFQPELSVSHVDILSEAEKKQLLTDFNPVRADYPSDQTIHGLFEEQAARTPDHLAIVFDEEKLTYRQLNERANLLAVRLVEEGVRREDFVGIMAERSIEMVVGMLAILKAGGAYVPIDPGYPQERIQYLLEDSGTDHLLVQDRYRDQTAMFGGKLLSLNDTYVSKDLESLPANIAPDNLAYVIYTSGSTGKPKGVMVEHRNVIRLVKNTNYAQLDENTRILQTGAVVFDASTFEIWGALLCGGQLILTQADVILDGRKLKQAIQTYGITTMWLTAPLFNQLSQQESKLFDGLNTLIVGGDVLSVPHINRVLLDNPSLRIVNGYGPTENTTFSTTHPIEGQQREAVPIGRPIMHSTAYIVDRNLRLVPLGAWGELLVGGDGVARGYLSRPELTADKFIEDPFEKGKRCYKTGDLVRWRADGTLEYKGRMDEQVKIRGYRIELAEVETELLKVDSVLEAVVIVREDEHAQKYLCAYFAASFDVPAHKLREALLRELPGYMVPTYFVQVERIPLNPNGKVDRRALPEPETALQAEALYTAPRTPLESQLETIWKQILGLPKVGVKDHFFEIGGHSLRATALVSAIHKELNRNVQLSDIFQHPTIEQLANVLSERAYFEFASIPVVMESEWYPVSSAQKRMYLVSQLSGAGLSYNMPGAMVLEGKLHLERLEAAFTRLIERHDTLRTSFDALNGEPVQRVHLEVPIAIERMQAGAEEQAAMVQDFVRPFDLGQAPLMRAGLIAEREDRHILLFDMHHIISDGASMDVFMQEIIQLYQQIEPAPLRIQYKDYAAWQRQQSQSEAHKQHESEWLQAFSGELPVLDLPTDFPRPAMKSFQGSTYEFELDKPLSDALKQIAAQTGSTLYMVLLAAFTTLLYKYSGQEDIIVGTPVAGRKHPDLEPLIGMFVNTLALRHYPAGGKTFLDFVHEVKERTIQAFDHQDYPLEELLGKLEWKRDLSRNPLFDIVFALQQNDESANVEIEGLKISSYSKEHKVAKFDLTLFASEQEEAVACSFEYATSLFKRESMARMAAHLTQLIRVIADNPHTRLSELDIAEESEKTQIRHVFNDTTTAFPRDKTIHALFEEQAAQTPEATALVFEGVCLTYRELNERANRLARTLRAEGVGAEAFVGLLTERSLNMIVGILGILKAGGAYVPIDPEYPEERIRFLLEDSGAKLLLAQERLAQRTAFDGKLVILDDAQSYDADGSNLEPIACADHLAYVIYTSGTTGKPKGNLTTHRNIVRVALNTNYIQIDRHDIVLQLSSYAFDGSTFDIFSALLSGAKLVMVSKSSFLEMEKLSQLIEQERITVMFITTALFNVLIDENIGALRTTRRIMFGGERASVPHVRKALRFLGPGKLMNVYGPTETTVFATYYPIDEVDEHAASLPIGRPISNTKAYIVSTAGYLQPIGIAGELLIAGDGVARGYLNRPDVTAAKFMDSPFVPGERIYRTGDLARWLPDGHIEFLGRIDDQVKIRGYRIELGEVEAELLKVDGVKEAIVIAREDENARKHLCAYYTSERELSVGELRSKLSHELPGYMIPSFFVQMEELPLTVNGKIDRRALPAPSGDLQTGAAYAAPRSKEELALAAVWQSVLGANQVGIHDNFFNLGGDSIKSIQVSSRLLQAGYRLEMKDLFEHPTIAELGSYLRPAARVSHQGEVRGETALTPVLHWFFKQMYDEPHYFNQSVLLYRQEGFDAEALQQALHKVTEHHDALRIVFRPATEGVEAWNRAVNEGELFGFDIFDLRDSAECGSQVEALSGELQNSIDLANGPLMKLGLFRCPDGDHLLITIHHAVVDGVSWRILFEDIFSAYEQALNGSVIHLPLKTDSFQKWAEELSRYAASPMLAKESAYWAQLSSMDFTPLPKDGESGDSRILDSDSVTAHWTERETEQLLKTAHRAYNTEVNDLLLCALALTVHSWSGIERILVNLEGHGREPIIPNIDVTRTVGWFTSQYPVVLNVEAEQDISYLIKSVKESLRRIPNKGIGYGIVKYLAAESSDSVLDLKPQISFNYLGQFDQDLQRNAIQPSDYSYGMPLSEKTKRAYALDINGFISAGQLGLTINYNSNEYRRDTMERFAELLQTSLQSIIFHCVLKERTELTPSDLTHKGMTIQGVEQLAEQLKSIGEIENAYALTPMQQGMLFHNQLDPRSTAYFEHVIYDLNGSLDVSAFQEALNRLVQRHAVLRSNYIYDHADKPLQVVFKHRRPGFYYEDFRGLTEQDRDLAANTFKADDKTKGFDLSQDPLFRLSVLQLDDDTYRMIWSFHHILMDGWCVSLLNGEVFEHYFAILENREAELAPVMPYSTYIEWLVGQNQEEAAQYWRQYLDQYEQEVRLPSETYDQPQSAGITDRVNAEISLELTERLNRAAKDNQVTINSLIQTAWGLLLHKYNNSNDAVFGSVVSGRPSHILGIETMIGLFINTVPVRIRCEGDETVAVVMRRTQAQAVASQPYDTFPLFEAQTMARTQHDLVNHLVIFENYPIDQQVGQVGDERENDFRIANVEMFEQTNYDFSLCVFPGESLFLSFEYDIGSYTPAEMKKIQGHFVRILEQIAANPHVCVKELELTTQEEKRQLLESSSSTNWELVPDRTFHQVFEEQAMRTPEQTAVVFKQRTFTYRELNDRANHLAALLRAQGVGRETIVGILADRCAELIVSVLAVWKAGGAYVPIDPDNPAEQIQFMLKDCGAKVLLTLSSLKHLAAGGLGEEDELSAVFYLDDDSLYQSSSEALPYINEPHDLAYVIYTSSTTDVPKGVMVEHRSLINTAYANRIACRMNEFDIRLLQLASFSFDVFILDIVRTFLNGGMMVICPAEDRIDPTRLFGWIRDYEISVFESTPALLVPLMDYIYAKNLDIRSLRLLITGSDSISVTDYRRLLERFGSQIRILNGYGITETTIGSSYYDEPLSLLPPSGYVPIGKAYVNNRFYIVDGYLNPVPVGVAGELCISGAGVARGYLNGSELTASKFIANPFAPGERLYRTGDWARWRGDGNIDFIGRIDDQVKIRGLRVELGEIETAMHKFEGVRQVIVVERKDDRGQSYLCGYTAGEEPVDTEALLAYLRHSLPSYKVPSRMMHMERLPLTPNGKLDRRALPEPDVIGLIGEGFEAPRNEIEVQLVHLWEEVLGITGIGVRDNFFDKGGHSLKVLELVRKIDKQFGQELTPRAVFDTPTIEGLALKLTADVAEQPWEKYVTKLNDKGALRVFCFPPMLGYGMGFAELANQLNGHAIVYGLDFIDEYENEEDLLEQYMLLIQSIQHESPYVLLGYSMGGNLAFELAKAMESKGLRVSDIIMVDSLRNIDSESLTREKTMKQIDRALEKAPTAYKEVLNGKYKKKVYAYAMYGNEVVNTGVVQANIHVLLSPKTASLKAASDAKRSWRRATSGSYSEAQIIGKHDELLEAGNVEENARKIRLTLSEIAEKPVGIN